MANSGWIKLWRNVLQNPLVMKDPEHFMLWHILLCMAKFEPTMSMLGGKPILLKPGQFTTGRKQLAVNSGISESKVERILSAFEFEHQIEQRKTNKNRLITIVNWDKYQTDEQRLEQPVNNNWTTTEQPLNTPKEYKNIRNKEINNPGGSAADFSPSGEVDPENIRRLAK